MSATHTSERTGYNIRQGAQILTNRREYALGYEQGYEASKGRDRLEALSFHLALRMLGGVSPANAAGWMRGFRHACMDRAAVGYVVRDQLNEAYALRESMEAAREARADAELHLDDAATCGHPDAPAWVAKRLPIEIRPVSQQQWDEYMAEGTPVLDREP